SASAVTQRGREIRRVAAAPSVGAARADLHLAGVRTQPDLLPGMDVPRHALHRSLEPDRGPEPHPAHVAPGVDRQRCKLTSSQSTTIVAPVDGTEARLWSFRRLSV